MNGKKQKAKEVSYTTRILKFDKNGEKTGWTYIEVPADVAELLFPGNKKSFRVKGKLDSFSINRVALIPMGGGAFILPINAALRKGTGKRDGALLHVVLRKDETEAVIDPDLLECLNEEEEARDIFFQMPKSHRNYYSKWIESAKTTETKAKRIARVIDALLSNLSYAEMIKARN